MFGQIGRVFANCKYMKYCFYNNFRPAVPPQDGAHLSEGCLKGYEVKLELLLWTCFCSTVFFVHANAHIDTMIQWCYFSIHFDVLLLALMCHSLFVSTLNRSELKTLIPFLQKALVPLLQELQVAVVQIWCVKCSGLLEHLLGNVRWFNLGKDRTPGPAWMPVGSGVLEILEIPNICMAGTTDKPCKRHCFSGVCVCLPQLLGLAGNLTCLTV